MTIVMDYNEHFEIRDILDQDQSLIPCPDLYPFSDEKLYAAILNRLAQPLPTGEESPFSSQAPTTQHAMLVAAMVHLQSIISNEFNHIPDQSWVQFFQMLGASTQPAEYPIINIVFERSTSAASNNLETRIPANTAIRSNLDSSLVAYTTRYAFIQGSSLTTTVPARLNRLGGMPNIRRNEFSVLPRSLAGITRAFNDGTIVKPGRSGEKLADAMLRAREQFSTGSRCVTLRDYQFFAKQAGAKKVNVIPGRQVGTDAVYRDLTTVAVYPSASLDAVRSALNNKILAGDRIEVLSAGIIPLIGTINVKITSALQGQSVFNIVAKAIASKINPPYGKWGDKNFKLTLAEALEMVNGIYAVPTIDLRHARTEIPLEEIEPENWQLFEIQSGTAIAAV